MEDSITGILLAAGLSTRMGTPKQLLPFGQSTIIETVIDNLLHSKLDNVIVVVGYQASLIQSKIKSHPIQIAFNPNYHDGMLSSAQCGIRSLPKSAVAFAITLVDQPLITPDLINIVIDAHRKNSDGITIPRFNNQRGHPTIFDRRYVETILALDQNSGGVRSILQTYADDIFHANVNSDRILQDIDEREDYKRAIASINR